MPKIQLPPTPGSSTDIIGKDGTRQLDSLSMALVLPEPALGAETPSQQRTPIDERPSPSRPTAYTQPSETVKSRRRSSAALQPPPKDHFALPPPPTRSRKIIHMKPRAQAETSSKTKTSTAPTKIAASSTATTADDPAAAPPLAGSKRKQPASSTAAGRKMARKTAHSLIERRRRSKMNEEFALLKSMIPACSGEMHKLAILQASIEYIRYLEDCVVKLKDQRTSESHIASRQGDYSSGHRSRYVEESCHPADHSLDQEEEDDDEDAASPDVEMEESDMPSPALTATHNTQIHSRHVSVSPVLLAQQGRHDSRLSPTVAAVMVDYRRNSQYEYAVSATTSPAFGPQSNQYAWSDIGSALTSPALGPQRDRDVDREATAALLMLNQSDRRGTGGLAGRGMSVRDLLSS